MTSAACECAHSKVDLVQSAVRASMCSDRLENLVVTSSEKQTVDELSADAVIDDLSTCTKIPTAGAYSAPPGSLAGIKRRYFSRGGKQTGEERKEGEVPKNLDPPVTKTQLCPCMESEKIMTPVMGPIAPMNMVGMIMIKYTSEIEFEEVISPNNMVEFRSSLIPDPHNFGDIQASISTVGKYDQRFTAGYDYTHEERPGLADDLEDFVITDE